jgi:Asp-tRNA(Asn)/Glu-tRNA(Gln) amidotransferase A subunit family amidase
VTSNLKKRYADRPRGSKLLEGSIPPTEGFIAKTLRDAGAIIIAKVNLSEFAGAVEAPPVLPIWQY